MAALLGFGRALARIVDPLHLWTADVTSEEPGWWEPAPAEEEEEAPAERMEQSNADRERNTCSESCSKECESKQVSQKMSRRKAKRAKQARRKSLAKSVVPIEDSKPEVADQQDCLSSASTCGSSDEEDNDYGEEMDLGLKEMKLMQARAQQIKMLSRPTRATSSHRRHGARKQKTDEHTDADALPTAASAPIRLQNNANALWNWSVYSGYSIDLKFPRSTFQSVYMELEADRPLADEQFLFIAMAAELVEKAE